MNSFENINEKNNISSNNSLVFNWIYYLKQSSVDKIINDLNKKLSSITNFTNLTFPIQFSTEIVRQAYIFSISNKNELMYAINMNRIYFKIVKSFFEKVSNMNLKIGLFDRLFKIEADKQNIWRQKSLDRTDSHDIIMFHISPGPHKTVPYEFGEMSHFRRDEWYFKYEMPITALMFDLNYFKCFYVELLRLNDPQKYHILEKILEM